jgi:mannose-6-phosphate isomerase
MAVRLACTIMPYAWGSRSAIAQLTGRGTPSAEPEAEMWMGAHPVAPARRVRGDGERSLVEANA